MGNKSYLILSGVLLLSIFYLAACNNPSNSLEESIAPYMELDAIEEASNTTIVLNKGEAKGLDSFFAFDISNLEENKFVREGLTEAWCVEWDKPIASNNDVHRGIGMYSTHGSSSWKPANYLMNIKNELKANDPSITYKEIQVALWSLIETPEFNLDKVLANNQMPSRMLTNGQPNFSITKTKEIINKVRSESADFDYGIGSKYLVYASTRSNDQDGGFETIYCGETAWADGSRYVNQGNWATYTKYEGVEKTVTLYAGQNYNIGDVTFSAPNNGVVTITITMNSTGGFQNVSENVKIQDYEFAPSANPSSGGFDHKATVDTKLSTFSIDVPQNKFYGVHVDALSSESCNDDDD